MLEEAARQFGARLQLFWHGYELRPEPVPLPDPEGEYIREHWRNRVLPMAAERGLVMRTPRRQVRSRPALQAAYFARAQGRFRELDSALFRARFEEDADISDLKVLSRLAGEAGIDPQALASAVTANAHVADLRADASLAARLGINGVPAAFVGPAAEDMGRFFRDAEPVVGAVPYELLAAAVERALHVRA